MSTPEPVHLVEVSPLGDDSLALIVQTFTGEQFILWPGEAPTTTRPSHRGLARMAGQGIGMWGERLPSDGCRLCDLQAPLNEIEAAELFALIADALSTLHTSAQAHGQLVPSHIAISNIGSPILLGAGRHFAEPQNDLDQLAKLWERWCPQGPLLDTRSATTLAEGLRMWLSVTSEPPEANLPGLVQAAHPQPMLDAVPLRIPWRSPDETVDEVGINIGPDEAERGLLDPLTWSGLTGEPTNELTGDQHEEDTRINAPQAAILSRLLQTIHQPVSDDRFQQQQGVPSTAIQVLLEKEPLDILPTPEAYAMFGTQLQRNEWEDRTDTAIHDGGPPTLTNHPTMDTQTREAVEQPSRSELSPSVLATALAVAVVLALLAGTVGIILMFLAPAQ